MYIPLENFQRYTNVFNENTELQQSYIDAAEDIVENYLGYKLGINLYTTILNGNGTNELQLKAKPIKTIKKVTINNQDIYIDNFETIEEFIYSRNSLFPVGNRNITIVYEAGYDLTKFTPDSNLYDGGDAGNESEELIDGVDAFYEGQELETGDAFGNDNRKLMPPIIKSSIMRIAALLQSEEDSNIGVTSKSFGDSGSRTFINYTDYSKYLLPLSRYMLMRI